MLLKYLDLKKWIGFGFVIVVMLGCGGGGGGGTTPAPPAENNTTKTAYFIDSAVQGVSYIYGDTNGTTNQNGKFTYDANCTDRIVFKLGGLTLGTILPSSISDGNLTIQDLVGVARTDVNNSLVLKIATLLQSLDSDGNASNWINVSEGNVSTLSGDINNSALTIDDILTQFNTANPSDTNKTAKSIEEVQSHLTTSMIAAGILDNKPDAFRFTTQYNSIERNTTMTSDEINISGINTPATISIAGGYYSIGTDENWTDVNGTISNGQKVKVRHTSSGNYATATTTTLTIGGVNGIFTTTTENNTTSIPVDNNDTTPDSFNFTSQTDVNISTLVISNDINISGLEENATIFVSSGEYSINGSWSSADGTIANGQIVQVRHTSAASFDTNTTTTLTIGGVAGTFTSKTRKADTTPNTFGFTTESNARINTLITSNQITISGLEGTATISISDGNYTIGDNNDTWTDATGTISNDQIVKVRHTSASNFDANTTTKLDIGGLLGTFTSTTESRDTIANTFSFTDNLTATKNSIITSDTINISGINAPTPISVVGGYYSINGNDGNWTDENGTIENNQTVTVRHTTSKTSLTDTNTTLTIGGVSDTFTTKTDSAYFVASLTSGKSISGVQFSCDDENGTTLSDGSFIYNCTGTITFKLNNLSLGTMLTNNINVDKNITLQEIASLGRDTIASSKLSKIVQLLHSLDKDKNSSNGIEIESKYLDENGTKIELNGAIESFTDEQLANELIRVGKYPKIKFEAMKDMLETLKVNGAAVKDFAVYPEANVTNVGPYTLVKIGFGESMLSSTITTGNIVLKQGANVVSSTSCNYDDTIMLATCKVPTAGLSIDTVYTVNLSTNIKKSNSASILAQTFSFTTGKKNILPKLQTGQTLSYNENGEVNTTILDDGYYSTRANPLIGTTRSFSKDGTEIVTDTRTTLAWIDDSTATSIKNNWAIAKTYCSTINTGSKTWRLPTMKELSLISDKSNGGDTNTSIFSPFANVAATKVDAYWSSDLDSQDANLSYAFLFYDGIDLGAAADDSNSSVALNIRCVSGDTNTSGGFVRDDVNQTVVDTSSGLMWQDNEIQSLSWSASIDYCENLTLAGFSDWRVPNYNEVLSTLEMKNYDTTATEPVYISPAFQYKSAATYWTSTSYAPDTKSAWKINFDTGGSISNISVKTASNNVRCIRGN